MTLCYVNKPSRRVATPPQHRALIVGKCSLKGHVSLACLQGSVTLGFDLIPQALIANYDHNRKYPKMYLSILQFLGKWSLPLVCACKRNVTELLANDLNLLSADLNRWKKSQV